MKSLLLSCVLLGLAACQSNAVSVGDAVPRDGDADVQKMLECRGSLAISEDRGKRSVAFDLVNVGDSKLDFVYTIDWFDRRGDALEPAERVWNRVKLGAQDSTTVRRKAPSPMAVAWCLRAVRPDQIR